MLARTCNQKPCELAQFETTLRMALPAARISCRACHVRCRHDVEPEERFKLNRNKYHAVVAARKRSIPFVRLAATCPENGFTGLWTEGAIPDSLFGRSGAMLERCSVAGGQPGCSPG